MDFDASVNFTIAELKYPDFWVLILTKQACVDNTRIKRVLCSSRLAHLYLRKY